MAFAADTFADEGNQHSMALLKILRSSQITLPAELRRQFGLAEGDYLKAHAVQEGLLLQPVTVVERQKARQALSQLLNRVHAKQPASTRCAQEQEEWTTREVKTFRTDKRATRYA